MRRTSGRRWRCGVRPAKPAVYLVDRPDSAQSIILVGSVQPPRDPAMDTRNSAFNALFGGNFTSRINMNLREDKGWSYGSRSSISGGRGPRTFIDRRRRCRPTPRRARWWNCARS